MKIRCPAEAVDYVRAMNKHNVGWASIEKRDVPRGPKRTETWTATLRFSKADGIVVQHVRKRGGRRINGTAVPKHVREFLLCDDGGFFSSLEREVFDALDVGGDITRISSPSALVKVVTFKVVHQPTVTKYGVLVGCEVGDSGSGPTEFLPFPTTEKALSNALDHAEAYAKDLEYETGWNNDDDEEDDAVLANHTDELFDDSSILVALAEARA